MALVAASAPVAHATAAAPPHWRLWRITRDGVGGRPLQMDVTVKPESASSLALVVGLRGTGADRQVVTSLFWEQGNSETSVYSGDSVTPICPGDTCEPGASESAQFKVGRAEPIRDDYLVLTWAANAKTTFQTKGWRVRELSTPRVRRIVADKTSATGARTNGWTIEHYTGAKAPGGSFGSVAWSSLPCDAAGQGTGQLTAEPALTKAPPPLACPDAAEEAAVSSRAVTWTVRADATGIASDDPITRLLVLDLPR